MVIRSVSYANEKRKNFIALSFPGCNPNEINWDDEIDEIKAFATFNVLPFNDETEKPESASIDSIIEGMVDRQGNKFSTNRQDKSNAWYASHGMTDDVLLVRRERSSLISLIRSVNL